MLRLRGTEASFPFTTKIFHSDAKGLLLSRHKICPGSSPLCSNNADYPCTFMALSKHTHMHLGTQVHAHLNIPDPPGIYHQEQAILSSDLLPISHYNLLKGASQTTLKRRGPCIQKCQFNPGSLRAYSYTGDPSPICGVRQDLLQFLKYNDSQIGQSFPTVPAPKEFGCNNPLPLILMGREKSL